MTQYTDLTAAGEMMLHSHLMVMVPRRWSLFPAGATYAMSWSVFRFNNTSRALIPEEPGVYAFLIAPNIGGNLNVSYLMYVGKTERTLRERFREYLSEAGRDRIRPNLLRILPLYPTHLLFACAPLQTQLATQVEAALLEAFLPPGNDQVPATVRRSRKAF